MSDQEDARRYRKLRAFMTANSESVWKEVENLAGVGCYMGTEHFDKYLDVMSETGRPPWLNEGSETVEKVSESTELPKSNPNNGRTLVAPDSWMHRHLTNFFGAELAPFYVTHLEGSYYDKSETRYYDREGKILEVRMGSYG